MKRHRRVAACAAIVLAASLSSFAEPSHIVIGGKAVTMVADAAFLFPQAKDRVVAVAQADQGLGVFLSAVDPGFGSKASIDRAAGAEVYASLGPDLVILKSAMKKSLGPSLDALSIKQLYLELETPEDYLRELVLLGEVFGDPARASELVDFYRAGLDEVASKAAGARAKPRVLVLQAGGDGGYDVPPAAWMQTILVERAGGLPVWKGANPGAGWARVGPEQIAAWSPDVVFLISYREKAATLAAAFRADPRFSKLPVVAKGKVYGFPQDFYSWDQPDTRWILGLRWMAKVLNPESFSGLSILDEARRFFSACYGMSPSVFDSVVAPRLSGDYGE